MSSKHILFILFFCFFLGGFLSAGGDGITVRAGDRGEPLTLDPAESWDSSGLTLIGHIFDRLVEIGPDGLMIRPSLALSWSSDPSGMEWTFKLRRGVRFHDGTSFDADAVVFTFKRQLEGKYKYGEFVLFKEIFPFLKDVKKRDKYEVRFFLKEPFFPFPSTLSADCASIISPSAMMTKKENFKNEPVGTGPFRFVTWKKGRKIVLESFEQYWKGAPAISRYVTIYEPNIDKLLDMFRQQKVDILYSFSISRLVIFKNYDWVATAYSPALSTNYIAFNMKNRYLSRIGVRKALNFLWNKDILKLVYQNHVEPLCSLFPKGMPGYDCEMDKYPMSIDKARELLRKEGLEKGFELKFLIRRNADLELPVVNIFSKNLRQAGIRLKIISEGQEEYNRKISRGDFDMTFSGWIADYPDPFNIISPLFSERIQSEGLANFSSGPGNREIRKMIEAARRIEDPVKREQFYLKLNNMVVDNALLIPLFQDINLVIYNKKIGKLKQNNLGKVDLFNLGQN